MENSAAKEICDPIGKRTVDIIIKLCFEVCNCS